VRGARRIVPAAWIRDTIAGAPDGPQAFAEEATPQERRAGAHYRNQWWVGRPKVPAYAGVGINGQLVFVHAPAKVVVAKFSTWANAWEPVSDRRTVDACVAIAAALSTPSS